jgi:uncharacterized membrane protein (UPF0182 family)
MRNSVKVVVDAYNGTITYYDVSNGTDPIIQAWSRAFPGMFTPVSQAPAGLVAHFRFPENLFQVQATQFTTYHVTDPAVFFQKKEVWQLPVDPTLPSDSAGPMHPYYTLMRLPGASDEQFQLIIPFTPANRQNMVAWMAASSDPGSYGTITAYTFPAGRNVDGPTQVFAQINQDPTFSAFRTLTGQQGSQIVFGDFLVIPIDDSLLYVQPVYVRSTQQSSIPELKRVIVVNGGAVGVGSTLADALDASTAGQPSGGGGGGGGGQPGGNVQQQISQLLNQALQHFQAADAALTAGNLGTYQSELQQAEALVKQANDLASQLASGPSATPTPSASASP